MEYITRYSLAKKLGIPATKLKSLEKLGLLVPDKTKQIKAGLSFLYDVKRIPEIHKLVKDTEYSEAEFVRQLGWGPVLFSHYRDKGEINPSYVLEGEGRNYIFYTKEELKRVKNLMETTDRFILPTDKVNLRLYPIKKFSERTGASIQQLNDFYNDGSLIPHEIRKIQGEDVFFYNNYQILTVKKLLREIERKKEKYHYDPKEVISADTLTERLVLLRRILKLNQTEMGEIIGVSRQTYCKYEAEPENITPEQIDMIIERTKISRRWLVNGKITIFQDE